MPGRYITSMIRLSLSTLKTNRSLLLCLFILGVVTAITLLPFNFDGTLVSGQDAEKKDEVQVKEPEIPNYDIRSEKSANVEDYFVAARGAQFKSASRVADVRDEFVRGEADLKARREKDS